MKIISKKISASPEMPLLFFGYIHITLYFFDGFTPENILFNKEKKHIFLKNVIPKCFHHFFGIPFNVIQAKTSTYSNVLRI